MWLDYNSYVIGINRVKAVNLSVNKEGCLKPQFSNIDFTTVYNNNYGQLQIQNIA